MCLECSVGFWELTIAISEVLSLYIGVGSSWGNPSLINTNWTYLTVFAAVAAAITSTLVELCAVMDCANCFCTCIGRCACFRFSAMALQVSCANLVLIADMGVCSRKGVSSALLLMSHFVVEVNRLNSLVSLCSWAFVHFFPSANVIGMLYTPNRCDRNVVHPLIKAFS